MKFVIQTTLSILLILAVIDINARELKPGTVIGKNIFGLAWDAGKKPLLKDGKPLIYGDRSLDLPIEVGESHFVLSVFKHDIGSIYLTKYNNDTATYLDTKNINLSTVGGVTRPDGGVLTPWGTLLVNENQMIDAANPEQFAEAYAPYYANNPAMVKAYNYGWNVETILLNEKSDAKVIKNYALGRLFASRVLVMPDNRSIYLYDGKHSGNLYLFVAAKGSSLTKGSLYVAKYIDGKYQYIKLGESSALKMKLRLKRASFANMFAVQSPAEKTCDKGFHYVQTGFGDECLKVRKRARKYAGLFEPIRVSAMHGVKAVAQGSDRLIYDAKKNEILFSKKNAIIERFSLGVDEKINSNYVIRGSL
jgi:hypothetical protein